MIVVDLTMAELAAIERLAERALHEGGASRTDLESLQRLEKTIRKIRAEHAGRLERGPHYDAGSGRTLCGLAAGEGVKTCRWMIGVTCPACRDLIRAIGRAYAEARRLRTVEW